MHGVHMEVILADGYALLLVGVAGLLEYLGRHSHRRSEHYRNSGFVYKQKHDAWECPAGQHLTRVETDFERRWRGTARRPTNATPATAKRTAPTRMTVANWKAVWTPGCNLN